MLVEAPSRSPPSPPGAAAIEPPDQGVLRFFYAVMLEAAPGSAAARLADKHNSERDLDGSRIPTDRLHVTLDHIGDFKQAPAGLIDFAMKVGDAVSMPSFEATFNHAGSFAGRPGHHPYVLLGDEGVAGFHLLRCAIGGAAAKFGIEVRSTSFVPHTTLLYGRRFRGPLSIEPISWVVRDFTLVLSHVGKTRYEFLRRWSLKSEIIRP